MALGSFAVDTSETNSSDDFPKSSAAAAATITAWRLMSNSLIDFSSTHNRQVHNPVLLHGKWFVTTGTRLPTHACLSWCVRWGLPLALQETCGTDNVQRQPAFLIKTFLSLFQESWFRFYRSTFHHKNNMSRQCRAWMSPQLPEERILSDLSSLPWSAWSLWPETISPWNMEEYHQLTTSHWLDWCTCIKHKNNVSCSHTHLQQERVWYEGFVSQLLKTIHQPSPKTCCTTQPAGWHNLILRRLRNAWTQKAGYMEAVMSCARFLS